MSIIASRLVSDRMSKRREGGRETAYFSLQADSGHVTILR